MHSTNLSIRIPISASTRTYEGLSPGMDGTIFLATPSDSVRMFRDHLIRSFPPSRPLSWNLPFRFLACHRWPSLEPELRPLFPSAFEDLRPYFAWSLGKLLNDVPGRWSLDRDRCCRCLHRITTRPTVMRFRYRYQVTCSVPSQVGSHSAKRF
ncbi:hypothetical protein BDP67DRAFT_494438 [Colletotrichum lupini]|nr:hypothetical protein BDP67DRAFT_494438 [Colletotrichum lupini]